VRDQLILRAELQTDTVIRDKFYRAYYNIPECNIVFFRRSITFQVVSKDIRNSLVIRSRTGIPQTFATDLLKIISGRPTSTSNGSKVYYTNRKYRGKNTRYSNQSRSPSRAVILKKYFICKKPRCWSTNHPTNEQKRSFDRYKTTKRDINRFNQYII
jgi:hypothetical protein